MIAKSGFPFEIRETLEIIEKYKDSTDLVNVVTPYKTYTDYNIKSVHYAIRENSSVNLLVVEISLEEIRQVELGYKNVGYNAKNVSNGDYADTKDTGKKTTKEPNSSALAKMTDWASDKLKGKK